MKPRTCLSVLTRLAARKPEATQWLRKSLDGRIEKLLDLAVEVTVETGGPLGPALAELVEGQAPEAMLTHLAARLDGAELQRSVPLRELSLAVAGRLMELRQRQWAEPSVEQRGELAFLHRNLATRLADVGRGEEALGHTRRAVAIYRRIERHDPDAYGPERYEEAAAALTEAAELWGELANARPDTHLPDLARVLHTLAPILGHLGEEDAAGRVAAEAAEIYRRLARERPAAFSDDLARALVHLAQSVAALGRLDQGVELLKEAIARFDELARQAPEVFTRPRASVRVLLGGLLTRRGEPEAALDHVEQALEIQRRLTTDGVSEVRAGLALGLQTRGAVLERLERIEEAIVDLRAAADLHRQLAAERPETFKPLLGRNLEHLARCLERLGRTQEASAARRESLDLD